MFEPLAGEPSAKPSSVQRLPSERRLRKDLPAAIHRFVVELEHMDFININNKINNYPLHCTVHNNILIVV